MGFIEGLDEGDSVGFLVGLDEGEALGLVDGLTEGEVLGLVDGDELGWELGEVEGACKKIRLDKADMIDTSRCDLPYLRRTQTGTPAGRRGWIFCAAWLKELVDNRYSTRTIESSRCHSITQSIRKCNHCTREVT